MTNAKISALTGATTPLNGTETLPIVQNGVTVKATVANITGAGLYPGSFTTLESTGNTTLGNATTDTTTVNGYMGVGVAASSANSINAGGAALTSVSISGVYSNPIAPTTATAAVQGVLSRFTTTAAIFTLTDGNGLRVLNAVKGAGSTITNQHGLKIEDQTQGINNYGITSLVSSNTNKWNIYASGTASNYFAGTVGVGTITPSASALLDVQSTTKGVRMPNMTTTQKDAIASPAAGLMVFDTTLAKLCVYSGATWQTVTSI